MSREASRQASHGSGQGASGGIGRPLQPTESPEHGGGSNDHACKGSENDRRKQRRQERDRLFEVSRQPDASPLSDSRNDGKSDNDSRVVEPVALKKQCAGHDGSGAPEKRHPYECPGIACTQRSKQGTDDLRPSLERGITRLAVSPSTEELSHG